MRPGSGVSCHSARLVFACAFFLSPSLAIPAHAQAPGLNLGPDASFARLDFSQITLDQQNKNGKRSEAEQAQQKTLINSGVVSALDLAAPSNAVAEFNRAAGLMRAQNSKEAIIHLKKALAKYPKFVSAHVNLGLAYLDQGDSELAKSEFETAAGYDDKFPGAFLNLGLLSLSRKEFAAAESELEKAASLQPRSAKILSSLAYAQKENQQYRRVLETVQRVHTLEHKGSANVHYLAASAAMALKDFETMRRELRIFLDEDPSNALAPVARQNLEVLARTMTTVVSASADNLPSSAPVLSLGPERFSSEDRLKKQLDEAGTPPIAVPCQDCDTLIGEEGTNADSSVPANLAAVASARSKKLWTIRKIVDEVSVSFAVSSRGRMVANLELADIQIRDDNKVPEKVLEFTPQSRLPLRLALLVDTSGSVHSRFSFERRAAARFLQRLLKSDSDLGFVAGFGGEITVTQDFTADTEKLTTGIKKLTEGGGTALFDAVSFAVSKLAEYPDRERVARVLVVLTDGEDTSSRNSLKQSIQDIENSGVLVYAVSTRDEAGPKTTEDKILKILADRSGGEAMFPIDLPSLGKAFDKLPQLIRDHYVVAYKPADFRPDGNYRTIQISAQKNGKRLQVHARKGYYARLESPLSSK